MVHHPNVNNQQKQRFQYFSYLFKY